MNNVFIIDSDLENCKKIKYSLQNTDTDVYYTHSIMEALGTIQKNAYSLIIMDVLLSQNGGLDILRAIRQTDKMPILALSEQASAMERVLALNSGADDVLNKPYDLGGMSGMGAGAHAPLYKAEQHRRAWICPCEP